MAPHVQSDRRRGGTRRRLTIGIVFISVALSWLGPGAPSVARAAAVGGRRSVPTATIRVPRDAPTIQTAVDRAPAGALVLISPGVYRESVVVTKPDLVIRGSDRNRTVLDGQSRRADGIDVRADGVALENLTTRNYRQNGFFWHRVDGYRGSYLTAYRDGRYGLYASASQHGQFDHSFASGSGDAGIYIGACDPCHAAVVDVVGDDNAIGFSGTNASGDLVVVNSRWHRNRLGIVPNSLDDEPQPPQDGMVIVGNEVVGGATAAPRSLEFDALDGSGIALIGVRDDTVTNNRVISQARAGIVVTPNPGIQGGPWASLRNQVRGNAVQHSGTADLLLVDATADQGNCFEQNQFRTSAPVHVEHAAPCRGAGSASLNAGAIPASRLFALRQHKKRAGAGTTPAPPPQPRMPDAATAPPRPATAEPSIPIDLARIEIPRGPR